MASRPPAGQYTAISERVDWADPHQENQADRQAKRGQELAGLFGALPRFAV